MFFVLAREDGDSEPSVCRIFSSEENAIAWAKTYDAAEERDIPQLITHQYDLDRTSHPYILSPLWLGRAEEGEEIVYYKGLTNEWFLEVTELTPGEASTVRPLYVVDKVSTLIQLLT